MSRAGVITVSLLFAGVVGCNAAYVHGTDENLDITVKDKERIVESDSEGKTSSKYLVFGENETFENTDSWFKLKFNSSDVQGSLEKGKSYNCEVYGWRIPFLSQYRNIVECAPTPNP